MSTGPSRARRAAAASRTRAIVGGASLAAFLALLAAVGVHDRSQPASSVSADDDGAATTPDPAPVRPNLGEGVYGNRFGGGYSATPGNAGGFPTTRSHGS